MGHASSPNVSLSPAEYCRLADFRYQIRSFLEFSEKAARSHRIEPQQHQLLLTVKGLAPGIPPTVTALSERLCLRHHSTVELIDRMVTRGLIVRSGSDYDRRKVLIALTPEGESLLEALSLLHWQELQNLAPALSKALRAIVNQSETKTA